MSTDEIFQNFFDKVLEPAITKAVTKAVKDTMLQQSTDLIDLAGSSRLYNFFDSVFEYGSDHVITCEIVKDGCFAHFRQLGCCPE